LDRLANAFNLKYDRKNFILVAFQIFAFLHSQGPWATSRSLMAKSALRPNPDIVQQGRLVRKGPTSDIDLTIRSARRRERESTLGFEQIN
jgi:hypothetical protein